MRKHTRRAALKASAATAAAGVFAAATTSAMAADAQGRDTVRNGADLDRPDVQRVLGRAVAEGGLPGILARVRHGHRLWNGTAGVADLSTGRARHSTHRFRIGSTTKTFTATVMLQLVAEGKLGLDDTVEKWLPGLVHGNGHDGSKITIRHLLSMTSGIFNYSLDERLLEQYTTPKFLQHRFDRPKPEELVEIAMRHQPDFEPGTDWTYSNTGYILAGMIIERVTGNTYADEIDRRITRPLDLSGTTMPRQDEIGLRGPHSTHYSRLPHGDAAAEVYDVTEMNAASAWSAGGMVSTVADLDRFITALIRGLLLPAELRNEMFTTLPTEGKWIPNAKYGLGMSEIELACGATVWGMGGAINGSWSYTYGTADANRMASVNVNGDWADGTWNPPNPIGVFTQILEAEFCR